MISFIKGLLTSDVIIESGINGLDKLHFSDQEKSEHMMEFVKATAPMARARRFIAIMVTLLWCFGVLTCGLLLFSESDKFDSMTKFMAETVNTPFSIIIGFYFLAHVVGKAKT